MADAVAVSFRKGDRSQHETFRGVEGEVTVDTETKTVWVSVGDPDAPGTPLAREDMQNVNTVNLAIESGIRHAGKNLLYEDLSNITTIDENSIDLVKNALLQLGYAYSDMSNVNTTDLATVGHGHSGNNLAYANLSNTNTNTLAAGSSKQASGDGLAYGDLKNISYSTDTATRTAVKTVLLQYLNTTENPYAKIDLSNVNPDTIIQRGSAAKSDLSNISLGDAVRAQKDIQKITNCVNLKDNWDIVTDSQYPTATSVKQLLNERTPIPVIKQIQANVDDATTTTAGYIFLVTSQSLQSSQWPILKRLSDPYDTTSQMFQGDWCVLDLNDTTNYYWYRMIVNSGNTMTYKKIKDADLKSASYTGDTDSHWVSATELELPTETTTWLFIPDNPHDICDTTWVIQLPLD